MFTAFLDMVGALMIIPLLPFYAKRFGASDFAVMALVASFSAMQLVSAPLWGRVSDRYGRKPALLFGLGASMMAYVVFAYADSYWLLLVSRIIQGAGGGTTGVIQAYVADSVAPKDRARGLGWLSSATNAGVAIGPALASFSHKLGPHWPGLVAAVLCGLNILFALRYLPESHDAKARLLTRGGRTTIDALALSVGLVLVPLMRPIDVPHFSWAPFALAIALVPLGAALNFPSVTALLSRVVGENERGLYMGVQQTYGGLARVIYPLVAGISSDHLGEKSPFWISGALLLSTIAMGSGLGRYSRRTAGDQATVVAVEGAQEAAATE